jgi:hypothetical protein
MLLSINESKVQELLSDAKPAISVTASSVATEIYHEKLPLILVSTTAVPEVAASPDFRSDLLKIRGQIEKSGISLKSTEELEAEIDEMRGRT